MRKMRRIAITERELQYAELQGMIRSRVQRLGEMMKDD